MIRRTFFWLHLVAGVAAGLVILMMSATGVALTYERQLLASAERSAVPPAAPGTQRLDIDSLLDRLRAQEPGFEPGAISLSAAPRSPVVASQGRSGRRYLDPYTGDILPESAPRLRAFFDAMTAWHRWFNVEGEGRDTARAITGASNLLFLFLLLSGLYLWLPPTCRWLAFRTRLWFNPKVRTSKARDYNWHHMFGIWIAVPMVVIVASAAVFSYGWANDLVYRSVGEAPPERGRRGPPGAARDTRPATAAPDDSAGLPLEALAGRAMQRMGGWQSLTMQLPAPGATTVDVSVDLGSGGQPQLRHDLTLDTTSGAIVAEQPFTSQTAGRRARTWIRFLHTGEALGLAGQTVAGIVSLVTLLMVWTGLALAWRRLIAPLFRRREPLA